MSWLVPEAREIAKRAKKLFTEDESAAITGSDPSEDIDVSAGEKAIEGPNCLYCEKNISLPCFVCVECSKHGH
jgi:hypothetical protein